VIVFRGLPSDRIGNAGAYRCCCVTCEAIMYYGVASQIIRNNSFRVSNPQDMEFFRSLSPPYSSESVSFISCEENTSCCRLEDHRRRKVHDTIRSRISQQYLGSQHRKVATDRGYSRQEMSEDFRYVQMSSQSAHPN
jgi:hypothetical protein